MALREVRVCLSVKIDKRMPLYVPLKSGRIGMPILLKLKSTSRENIERVLKSFCKDYDLPSNDIEWWEID